MRRDPVEPEVRAGLERVFDRVTERIATDLCTIKADIFRRMERALTKGDVVAYSYRGRDNIRESIEELEDHLVYIVQAILELEDLQRTLGTRGRRTRNGHSRTQEGDGAVREEPAPVDGQARAD